ncbi:NUDIX hydrolase [Tenacibaculum holothuriorum]|uniref:NUDIX hydrolase n=1 Tax=Tenacibaculum holothuriorum TaxID=1635173 RepID=A0A1Y2PHW4_9FLAO|nr:CoA pyrophosphatase [Tenacibaculum holothuriorum]OSY89387.1 NUDIX hydrolase [Tenacibaculum holothuriorum]
MDFKTFISKIPSLQSKALNGLDAQFKFAPKMRLQYNEEKIKAQNPRRAAVLAFFYPDEEHNTRFLLTQRASYNGTHSAQISFPGGKYDEVDNNLQETALREAFEEVSILNETVKIVREITDVYIPPSNFLATPFIGYSNSKPNFIPNEEVAEIIEVKLEDLLNDNNITTINITTSYAKNLEVPCFKLNDYIVWGATAMMLSEIRELF